jgi:hypothetical protein
MYNLPWSPPQSLVSKLTIKYMAMLDFIDGKLLYYGQLNIWIVTLQAMWHIQNFLDRVYIVSFFMFNFHEEGGK